MSKKEFRGAVALLVLVFFFFIGINSYIDYRIAKKSASLKPEIFTEVQVSDRPSSSYYQNYNNSSDQDDAVNFRLHSFDPNTVSATEMEQMAFPPKLIKTIVNFRSKGGKFYKPEDIKKLYTFREEWYAQVEPYILISSASPRDNYAMKEPYDQKNNSYTKKSYPVIDLNTATAEQLDQQWGVSPKVASNIVKFRDKLGGFYTADQVREVYTLPDSVYVHNKDLWKVSSPPQKININNASQKELNDHPYFRKSKISKLIINYRKEHGDFSSPEDLKKIKGLSDGDYEKIKNYITL